MLAGKQREVNMADKPFIKRWGDGRKVTAANLTDIEARVWIGDEYHILPVEEWRALPLFNEADRRAQGS